MRLNVSPIINNKYDYTVLFYLVFTIYYFFEFDITVAALANQKS